jgi:hypothetical protein
MTLTPHTLMTRSPITIAQGLALLFGYAACAGSGDTKPEVVSAAGSKEMPVAGAASGTNAGGMGPAAGATSAGGQPPSESGGSGGRSGGATGAAGSDPINGGMAGSGGTGGSAGAAGNGGTGPSPLDECGLSSPVSFKKDVEPFLTASCGKANGGGCHVTDNSPTAGSLCPDGTKACGFDHAYDWATAGSHNEFCKQGSTPIRYTVLVSVLKQANPPGCTSTRIMPPDGARATPCQIAAIEDWLAQPMVLQTHRSDDTSPAEPYLMPPFN